MSQLNQIIDLLITEITEFKHHVNGLKECEKKQIDLKRKIPFFVEDSTGKKHKVLTNKIAKDLLEGTERDSKTVYI